MNTDYEDQDENNLDDLENLDISKVIQSKYKQRRVGISQNQQREHQKVRQNQIAPDLENQPIQQTQTNQTTQSEVLVSRSDNLENEQKLITFRCQNNINQYNQPLYFYIYQIHKQIIIIFLINNKQKKNKKRIKKLVLPNILNAEFVEMEILINTPQLRLVNVQGPDIIVNLSFFSIYILYQDDFQYQQQTFLYVHEECLKQQILDEYNYKIRGAKCSSCQVQFNMIIEGNFIFLPVNYCSYLLKKLGWQQSKDKIPLCCLITFQLVLIVIVILLSIRLTSIKETKNRQNFLNSKVFIILFIVICCIISIILVWLITMIMRNILYVEKITKWKIIPYLIKQPSFVMQQNIEIDNKGILQLQQMIQQEQTHTNEDLTKSEYINTTKTQYKRYFTSVKLKQQESLIS